MLGVMSFVRISRITKRVAVSSTVSELGSGPVGLRSRVENGAHTRTRSTEGRELAPLGTGSGGGPAVGGRATGVT